MEEIVFVMITFKHCNYMIMSKRNLICLVREVNNFSEANLNDLDKQIELDDLILEYKEQFPFATIQKMVGIPYDNE